jgi:hypothetical protein
MRRTAAAIAAAIGLSVPGALVAQQPGAAPPAAPAAKESDNPVDPEAVQALQRMSAYLMKLQSFELKADTTLDLVTAEGQRIQLGGVSKYKVRAPNAFQIDITTDLKDRQFFYDGKQFTVFAPKLGFYATAPAPPTIRGTLQAIHEKFGIVLPLEDLFRWSDPSGAREAKLTSAFLVGPATIDGATTDHYAFREDKADWEVWIERGERPIPRKLVIVDRTDLAAPGYSARLTWNMNPTLAASDFTFRPGAGAKAIHFAELNQ